MVRLTEKLSLEAKSIGNGLWIIE